MKDKENIGMVSLKQRLNNLNGWQRLWVVFSFLALLASLVVAANLAQFETTDEELVKQLADPRCKPFLHIDVPYRYVRQLLDSTTFHQRSPAVQLLVYQRVAVKDKEFQRLAQSDQSTIRYEVLQTKRQLQGDAQSQTAQQAPASEEKTISPGATLKDDPIFLAADHQMRVTMFNDAVQQEQKMPNVRQRYTDLSEKDRDRFWTLLRELPRTTTGCERVIFLQETEEGLIRSLAAYRLRILYGQVKTFMIALGVWLFSVSMVYAAGATTAWVIQGFRRRP